MTDDQMASKKVWRFAGEALVTGSGTWGQRHNRRIAFMAKNFGDDRLMSVLQGVNIGVVGLGYVGLPLATEFGAKYPTIGFDIRPERIHELSKGYDRTGEVDAPDFQKATQLTFTCDPLGLAACNIFIITVPTPIDRFKRPDLEPLRSATETVAQLLKDGDLVIYESTVYPGATEEFCVPILESISGLRYATRQAPEIKNDAGHFFCGYSPERINPGDREHRFTSIIKVTSGSTESAAERVDALYGSVVQAGTHRAPDIRTAEAAKVIENTQRDVNIALINELAILFNRLGINTADVLDAAGTKWNFLKFKPGLVGGHCIGVDPYYLTHKAQEVGVHAEMILAGRRINDLMGDYVAGEVVKLMARHQLPIHQSKVLVLGLTFKENCPDLRNTKVVDVVAALQSYGVDVDVHDPWVDPAEAEREYGITPIVLPVKASYDAVVLAVAHRDFLDSGAEALRDFGHDRAVVYDVKNVLDRRWVHGHL
ncbi:MAG: hypothetical protein RLZZ627_1130 [Pseudomonadota bacterium]|jgi:UDP-N-acetyl-D-galactosamine dehydrogenase